MFSLQEEECDIDEYDSTSEPDDDDDKTDVAAVSSAFMSKEDPDYVPGAAAAAETSKPCVAIAPSPVIVSNVPEPVEETEITNSGSVATEMVVTTKSSEIIVIPDDNDGGVPAESASSSRRPRRQVNGLNSRK